jgi:peptidyl-prolyl cis-trans isomerase A (cyclophilin A)
LALLLVGIRGLTAVRFEAGDLNPAAWNLPPAIAKLWCLPQGGIEQPFFQQPSGGRSMFRNHRCLPGLLVAAVLMVSASVGVEGSSSEPSDDDSEPATDRNAALLDPSLAKEKAPDEFNVRFATDKGDFVIAVTRDWAPNGADRFYNLAKIGYFDDAAFFRNIEGFMVQFGINGDPAVNDKWHRSNIKDDAVKESNKRGYVTFAQSSNRNSRSTQVFINFGDNGRLDGQRFAPFGRVVEGMDIVESLYNGYGEGAPNGRGPDQGRIQQEGNAYLKRSFPKLDYIKSATIEEPEGDR